MRLLANQGCDFRGNDESADFSDSENFIAVQMFFGRMNIEFNSESLI